MSDPVVTYESKDRVATITLNRPDKMNALSNQLPVRPALYAGLGLEEMLLPKPVRPGYELHLQVEVIEARRSKSRPETGVVQTRQAVVNQDGDTVLTMTAKMIVRAREAR